MSFWEKDFYRSSEESLGNINDVRSMIAKDNIFIFIYFMSVTERIRVEYHIHLNFRIGYNFSFSALILYIFLIPPLQYHT